uniref:Uncharacterized protein n=1 Tax=Erwinia amylovora ATCC BAA-2158 TaxID=889211 RepID=E5B8T6_ERWAM|nr:hypothetical protein predicted by Glimmer/Critica [Erwinia amylovora ATCC BAA-2158]
MNMLLNKVVEQKRFLFYSLGNTGLYYDFFF